jgi:hypothetical protein
VPTSAFLETKAAVASAVDLMVLRPNPVLIFDLQLDRRSDEGFFRRD